MMDLREIIKWFIPCFHLLLKVFNRNMRLTLICLFLLYNFDVGSAANVKSVDLFDTKNVGLINENKLKVNQSGVLEVQSRVFNYFNDGAVGRTFGRPFKKMMGALLPLVFQIGAASTWAVVAALVGVKTLAVTLIILKILLIAGAAKALAIADSHKQVEKRESKPWYWLFRVVNNGTNATGAEWAQFNKVGALFGSKGHHQGWEQLQHPQQKEIHLHIHNGHHEPSHEDHVPVYGSWSREDGANALEQKNPAIEPYSIVGPQTIRTPFGNYVKVESNEGLLNPT